MERLTYYDGIATELKDGTRAGIDDAIEKLAEYEDLDFTPQKIKYMLESGEYYPKSNRKKTL